MNTSRHLPLKVRLSGNITGTAVPPAAHNRSAHPQRAGFTLLELIVMAAILALVALVLAPGLAHTGPNVRAVQCLSNLAQMQAGANMYPADFNDTMLPNATLGPQIYPGWVITPNGVNWTFSDDNTNVLKCLGGTLAPYIQNQIRLYKCPGDTIPSDNGPRLRSYSMNGMMGYHGQNDYNPGWRSYKKVADLGLTPGLPPSQAFIFCEENMLSLNDGYLQLNLNQPWFLDVPGSYHNGALGISFADGHVELHKWVTTGLLIPVRYGLRYGTHGFSNPLSISPSYADWYWLRSHASTMTAGG